MSKSKNPEVILQRVRQRLDTFEKHVRAEEMAGAADPDDRVVIEADYRAARKRLEKFIMEALCLTS